MTPEEVMTKQDCPICNAPGGTWCSKGWPYQNHVEDGFIHPSRLEAALRNAQPEDGNVPTEEQFMKALKHYPGL